MNTRNRLIYVAWVGLAVVLTWLIHEFAHWGTGTLLGYEMQMTFNTAGLVEGSYVSEIHRLLVRSAGPAVTLLQAFVAFFILRKTSNPMVYPYLFIPFYMRLVAGAMNFISINDEGAVSQALGLGTFTMPALVSLVLLVLVIQVSRSLSFKARFQAATAATVMLFSTILIFGDQLLGLRLL